ncbi:MAG TPA: three-Cys-motif partner protein TcmP [Candidatus Acidoferrales bacterium]|nr:three-Cys-motif partner protein TcmP [Candidatus Acidoferrales bacterium]
MDEMGNESQGGSSVGDELQHLKRVSRVKHIILEKYFPPWARILGSRNRQLAYVDCFAGPGQYEMEGKPVEGSPIIAVKEATKLVHSGQVQSLLLYLVDDDLQQVKRLEARLKSLQPHSRNLTVEVRCADSRSIVPNLLQSLPQQVPAFFLIDPYGHPLSLPVIRQIQRRQQTEVLINLMWFQINRDLNNPKAEPRLNELFGDSDWHNQPFMGMRGSEREKAFLTYFKTQLAFTYVLPFRIRYDIEDSTGGRRTKYYLLHASNHIKAALLMKDVMWPLGDEEGTFDYSGEDQGVLISQTPTVNELRDILLRKFGGREVTFDEIREQTWTLPFMEKHYRAVIRSMEGKEIMIHRVTSMKTGIGGADRIHFR